MDHLPGSSATARRVGGDPVRLCQPRAAALRGGRRPPRAALPRRRHRAAEAPPRRRPQGRIDRQPRARLRHAGSRIGADPDREWPSLLSRPRRDRAGAHRLPRGDRPPPVGLRRQTLRRRQHPSHDHGAAPRLAGCGHPLAGRPLPRAAAGGRRPRPSELGRGPHGDARDGRARTAAADGGRDGAATLAVARSRTARRRVASAARARPAAARRPGPVGRPRVQRLGLRRPGRRLDRRQPLRRHHGRTGGA